MNTKAKGRRGDFKARNYLLKYGYPYCMISAASLGDFDTVAWNDSALVFVQNKTNTMPPTEESLKLMHTRVPACALRFIFVWHDRKRVPEAWLIENEEMYRFDEDRLVECLLKPQFPKPDEEKLRQLGRPSQVLTWPAQFQVNKAPLSLAPQNQTELFNKIYRRYERWKNVAEQVLSEPDFKSYDQNIDNPSWEPPFIDYRKYEGHGE